jgi:hypothetical protein
MSLFMLDRFASCLDSPSHRLAFTACVMVLLILLGALTAELLQLQLMSRPCSDRLLQMGLDAHRQITLQRPSTYISS